MKPQSEQRQIAALHPLTPSYQSEKHAVYFEAIEAALKWTGEKAVRNIALTGSYGVGKSSILRQVASVPNRNIIQVSLSTLGFHHEGAPKTNTGMSDSSPRSGDSVNPLRETKTNQIQKEIVKQLLYTQTPEKMPGSRYRRTSAFNSKREVVFSLAAGIPIAVVFFLCGWTSKIASLLTIPEDWGIVANAGMAVVSAAFVFGIRHLTHNKIRIDSVSAGAATITLSSSSETYFDEYLDEIVYFFEVVKTDIVIFEDIDRFEDAHIFETLRELNTILNAAKQLDGRVIKFIYAIKDSIFEELGARTLLDVEEETGPHGQRVADAASLEVARANRTKFFDLVIPVVPFVTHQSARELMAAELADLKHSISEDLIDLVATHVADMRLIKNIRNEFVIFQEQIIRRSSLKLEDDQLFAMVLYKSTHLMDFERIKLGNSNLDVLYRESRQLVQDHTARLNNELALIRRQGRKADQTARSKRMGDAVASHIDLVLGYTGFSVNDIRYNGSPIPPDDMRTVSFWQKYSGGEGELQFTYQNPWRGNSVYMATISREELERITHESVDPLEWESFTRADLEVRTKTARSDIEFLSKADLADFMNREDFKIQQGMPDEKTFSERATALLGSKLAVELVSQGYINRYFTLYTSTFIGHRISANAMNFILKNVDSATPDFYFSLTFDESRVVLRERPRLAVRGKAAYNFDFVDYLLANWSRSAEIVFDNLRQHGADERKFVQAYLSTERDFGPFVRKLTLDWPDALAFLAVEADLDDLRRLKAVDAALVGLGGGVAYTITDEVGRYLEDNHVSLAAFTDQHDFETADRLAKIVDEAGFDVADLTRLSEQVRRSIVKVGRFKVTRANILLVIAPQTDLSLNALKDASDSVYKRVISDLDSYLDVLADREATVTDVQEFIPIIKDVDEVNRASHVDVIGRSKPECYIHELNDIATGAWPALALHRRFPSSIGNVSAYMSQYGLDSNLAVVLSAGVIVDIEEADEEERLEIASTLVGGSNHLPSAELRVCLLESLGLEGRLPLSAVPRESGELVGLLIEKGIISDNAESFALVPDGDWSGLEYAITVSESLDSFVSPAIITPSVTVQFLASRQVPANLKQSVVERLSEFASGANGDVIKALAAYAIEYDIEVAWSDVVEVASEKIGPFLTLQLVRPFLDSAVLGDLVPILEALGGDYSVLGAPNGKRRRFPNTDYNMALLIRLKELGTVNSIVPDGSDLRVNMKRR
ncbi:YobI family P-loop NTPase [Arthrobacter koreensis]|uniref:YobI family P-loop NTPase n=1 Tax=Arthrobacter koreensis TaxID=199136 RepID=UPI0036D8FBE8